MSLPLTAKEKNYARPVGPRPFALKRTRPVDEANEEPTSIEHRSGTVLRARTEALIRESGITTLILSVLSDETAQADKAPALDVSFCWSVFKRD